MMKKVKHFLHISDYTSEELWNILHLSKEVKERFRNREDYRPFRNKSLAMIFAKPSARTRVSFDCHFYYGKCYEQETDFPFRKCCHHQRS